MKRLLLSLIIFSSLILTACASVPIATMVPGETPVPSPSPTNTPTASPTETPAPKAAEIDIKPVYTEKAAGELLGVKITTNLITDASLNPTISRIERDDSYKNYDEAMTEFTAKTFYYIALKKGGIDGTGIKNEDGTVSAFEQYMAMWDKAQESGSEEDWRKVQVTIKLNDIATEGYETNPTVVWPMYTGDQIPNGVRAITEFNIVLFKSGDRSVVNHDPVVTSLGSNILNNTLYLYRGVKLSYLYQPISDNKNDSYVVDGLSAIPTWLAINSLPNGFDTSIIKIISNNSKSSTSFKSVINIK